VPDSTEAAHDRRFSNEFWANNPFFYGLRGAYDALAEYADAVLAIGLEDLDPVVARKAEFAVRAMLDGAAPSNFLFTNPVALERAARTGGTSLAQGYANYLRGLAENRGLPKQVDRGAFIVGEDLAVTPGQVVLRTDLIELIQYAPQTEQVHEIPLLCSPPWINRYYVMDLAPGRSFGRMGGAARPRSILHQLPQSR